TGETRGRRAWRGAARAPALRRPACRRELPPDSPITTPLGRDRVVPPADDVAFECLHCSRNSVLGSNLLTEDHSTFLQPAIRCDDPNSVCQIRRRQTSSADWKRSRAELMNPAPQNCWSPKKGTTTVGRPARREAAVVPAPP